MAVLNTTKTYKILSNAYLYVKKATGRSNTFISKIKFDFYMKALSTNYKPGLTELKNLV